MDITEQGKVISELTLTITVSTPSGKTYLKYCERGEDKEEEGGGNIRSKKGVLRE